MPGGRPPPLNLYRQPPSRIGLVLRRSRTNPRIRRKWWRFRILVEGQVEPRRPAWHQQPGARREAIGPEPGLHPPDPPAGPPYVCKEPAASSPLPHILHSIPSGGELPSADHAVCKGPHPAAGLRRPRNTQHRPEEGIVGHQPLHVLLGLGPDRGVAGDERGGVAGSQRARYVAPARIGERETGPAAATDRAALVLEPPAEAEVPVVGRTSGRCPALGIARGRGPAPRGHRQRGGPTGG